MTTIIATPTEIIGDRQLTDADTICHIDKIFAIRGSLIGFAGDYAQALKFLEWFKNTRAKKRVDYPNDLDDFEAIEISKEGLFLWGENGISYQPNEPFWAIGSGRGYALGALAAGSSVKEAMEIAVRYDPYTGGPFDYKKL